MPALGAAALKKIQISWENAEARRTNSSAVEKTWAMAREWGISGGV